MITPKEAVDLVNSKVDNFIGDTVFDYGPYYVVDNTTIGDMGGDSYKVDKETGEMSEFPLLEYFEAIKKIGDVDDLAEYKMT